MNLSEHDAALLAKTVDGTATPDEERALTLLLTRHPGLAQELQEMKRNKEATVDIQFRHPAEETWDRYWAGVYARLERGLAWLLISLGAIVLFGAAGYLTVIEFLADTTVSLPVKIGVGAVVLGLAVLLVSVVREKWEMRKSDKYREVVR